MVCLVPPPFVNPIGPPLIERGRKTKQSCPSSSKLSFSESEPLSSGSESGLSSYDSLPGYISMHSQSPMDIIVGVVDMPEVVIIKGRGENSEFCCGVYSIKWIST